MDLLDAAVYFDNDQLYDAYTGEYLYDGQFATYDGSQLDGSFVRRRTVSLGPDLELPPRRVVTLFGEQWVLSDPIVDGFYSVPIRKTMSARKSHGLYQLKTAEELVNRLPAAREAYAFARWIKATADAATSYMEPYFEFSLALTEPPIKGMFIELDGRVWHTRIETDVVEGFRLAECDEIVTGMEIATSYVKVTQGTGIDPVTLEETGTNTFKGVLTERYTLFRKLDQSQPSNYAGDKTLIIGESTVLVADVPLTIDGERWAVVANQPLVGGNALHLRRVA